MKGRACVAGSNNGGPAVPPVSPVATAVGQPDPLAGGPPASGAVATCGTIRMRVAIDEVGGHKTSPAVIRFIRSTCSCAECRAWRETKRAR